MVLNLALVHLFCLHRLRVRRTTLCVNRGLCYSCFVLSETRWKSRNTIGTKLFVSASTKAVCAGVFCSEILFWAEGDCSFRFFAEGSVDGMFVEGDCCAVTERGFVSDVSPSLRRSTLFSGPSTVGGDETSCWVFTGREVSSFFEREIFGDSSVHPPVRIENPSKKLLSAIAAGIVPASLHLWREVFFQWRGLLDLH